MRVFLTGATGLVGSHLADHLIRSGHDVRALVRPTSDRSFLSGIGAELVEGDVTDPVDMLADRMRGCCRVVHGAALVYASGEWETIARVNVVGTARVLAAAARSAVKKAVHISSVAVYSEHSEGEGEESSFTDASPESDHYARSKREAEREARRVERKTGLPVTIVRPAAVYGERDRLVTPALARILRLPLIPLLGGGGNTLPLVYAGNVAVAIGRALETEGGGDTYDLGMDHPLTQRQLFEFQAHGMGLRPRFVRLPRRLATAGTRCLGWLGVGTPGARQLPLERVARIAVGENPYVSRRAHEVLRWAPPHQHRAALQRTGHWWVGHHEKPGQKES